MLDVSGNHKQKFMYKISIQKILLLGLLIITSFLGYSQETNKAKLVGTWEFEKIEFIIPNTITDTAELKNRLNGAMVTFKEGNTFISEKKTKDSIIRVESGDYSITSDGKKIIQNNEAAEILILTDKLLSLKVEDMFIVYFEKRVL